jgi:hypothetical protein
MLEKIMRAPARGYFLKKKFPIGSEATQFPNKGISNFFQEYSRRNMKPTTDLHLGPRLRINGAINLIALHAFGGAQE